jgi:hypothetical protein
MTRLEGLHRRRIAAEDTSVHQRTQQAMVIAEYATTNVREANERNKNGSNMVLGVMHLS